MPVAIPFIAAAAGAAASAVIGGCVLGAMAAAGAEDFQDFVRLLEDMLWRWLGEASSSASPHDAAPRRDRGGGHHRQRAV